jgi:G3E family GTPase
MKSYSETRKAEPQHHGQQSDAEVEARLAAGGMRTLPRYIMIGGFLGAGKTTVVAQLARHLTDQGLRVGLITNDQGSELVDTATLISHGFPVEEIAGGCFCCRFNSLMEAAKKLSGKSQPDVFIAEPVGSCTDLVATVTYPLRRIYGHSFSIAPLSVLLDPIRALRVFKLADGGTFSEKVLYIYRKQLEEADIIVINKCDLLQGAQLETLHGALSRQFPCAERFEICARDGTGLEPWFHRITHEHQCARPVMDVDYETYAQGEALLGWLNATVQFWSQAPFDGNAILSQLAIDLQHRLNAEGAEVAHLKMTLDPENGFGDLGVMNLVRNDYVPELSQHLSDPLQRGELIVNMRAEVAPELLDQLLTTALEHCTRKNRGLNVKVQHQEHFRPGKPTPTFRMRAFA